MKYYLAPLALAFGAITSPALAGSSASGGQNTDPFTGPKVGIEAGYDSNNASKILPGTTVRTKEAAGGPSVRGFVGYDVALDQAIVLGAEFGIGAGGRESAIPFATGSYSLSPRLTYDLTGRIGFVPTPGVLLYGRAGVRWLKTTRETISTVPAQAVAERNRTNAGLTYGVGAEFALAPKLTLRTEFNHARYNRDLNQNKISIGAAYHF